jgi:hypothetical protein
VFLKRGVKCDLKAGSGSPEIFRTLNDLVSDKNLVYRMVFIAAPFASIPNTDLSQ